MDKSDSSVSWSSVIKFTIIATALLWMTHRDYELIERVNAVEQISVTQSPECVPHMEMGMPIDMGSIENAS